MATRPIEPLITDRKLSDINNKTHKGNYNASDLNRVETWMEYLKELLNEYGYYVEFTTKTDWEISFGYNMTSNIKRIKENLQNLKDTFYELPSTPDVPSTDRLSINYIEANNIEKIIYDIEYLILKIEPAYRFSNYLYSGEDIGLVDVEIGG